MKGTLQIDDSFLQEDGWFDVLHDLLDLSKDVSSDDDLLNQKRRFEFNHPLVPKEGCHCEVLITKMDGKFTVCRIKVVDP